MDYFSKFLRTGIQPAPKPPTDHAQEFHRSWNRVKNTLLHPDERQLTRGIKSTDVPAHLQSMVDSLVLESTRTEEGGTGACLEYLLKNDVLGTLVRLSETDRPAGIQAEVLRAVQNMVVLLDEQFLVHSAVHRAVLRLLRNCAGDDLQEQLDGKNKVMGAARNVIRGQPSEYEEDLVNLLCILCSRIRTYRELLMIFFHDKHWYRSEPLFSVEEEEEEEEDEEPSKPEVAESATVNRAPSPTPSQATVTSAPASSVTKKTEYEFLLFNYLLRFVHREGQIGDFARAGLLFLMDVAMSPGEPVHRLGDTASDPAPSDPITDAALALAEYILDGDFSEVLGAGLGAVYSLLPSKLEFRPPAAAGEARTGMIIGTTGPETEDEKERMEVAKDRARAMGIEDAANPDFKSRLDHFLKLLEFLQDVLKRNVVHDTIDASALVGTAIVQSILDAVRRIFLENVLYPSVLECSDADGSAVAVMSYIEVMIRTLQEGQLSDLLVNFLMSEDNDEVRSRQRPHSVLTLGGDAPPQTKSTDKQAKLRRRKSSAMVLLEMEAPESNRPSDYITSMGRFTLKDLLMSNLRSQSQPTATSALQLFQSMLLQHAQLSVDRLLAVIPDPRATNFPQPPMIPPPPSFSKPETEEDDEDTFVYPGAEDTAANKFDLIPSGPVFYQPETTYSTHEREMGLYLTLVSRVDPSHNDDAFSTGYDHYLRDALFSIQSQSAFRLETEESVDMESRQRLKHRLNPNDPILSLVLESLRKFFSNSPEFNIALTGVLATLAMHPDRSMAGWLTFTLSDPFDERPPIPDESYPEPDGDGDDRSVDFRIEEKLATDTNFLPASRMDSASRPIVHTIFHGLVSQLERYRQLVDNFDKFLLERRQGLLFSENLTDALTLPLDFFDEPALPVAPEPVQATRPKPRPSASSFVTSFLTPKKNKPTKPSLNEPATPPRSGQNRSVSASPFGPHYQQTGSISVEPFIAPVPSTGPWTPAKSSRWTADEEDVFGSAWSDKTRTAEPDSIEDNSRPEKIANVTLSQLLDNVVILEESIKELVAIIHARRSLGIDSVRYL
ncbi:Retinoic acid induced 16-like protein-domain-containing protein [Mycena maculata]|uniref:Retinoic acid induced 16-like protein-domain-containing protein n=1 Tax=Mycena maculata TaxID=230809 RepID=A0AAD7NT01_9AGAR|nr:Retinoic acid induced 16-like protein-domain-containing protein [Mycena maculata]